MATIIKTKIQIFCCLLLYGCKRRQKQRWETVDTYKEALRRKAEVEHKIVEGTFIPPANQTVSSFMHGFVSFYGKKKWSLST